VAGVSAGIAGMCEQRVAESRCQPLISGVTVRANVRQAPSPYNADFGQVQYVARWENDDGVVGSSYLAAGGARATTMRAWATECQLATWGHAYDESSTTVMRPAASPLRSAFRRGANWSARLEAHLRRRDTGCDLVPLEPVTALGNPG
jgi:hypothetical protein